MLGTLEISKCILLQGDEAIGRAGPLLGNLGSSGGGVFRDCRGRFCFGFSTYVRQATSLEAELHVLLIGLNWSIQKKFFPLIMESSSKILVDCVHQHQRPPSRLGSICWKAQHLISQNSIDFHHQYRETNSVADALAKMEITRKN
ncbi:hypothetical protein ACH5RR_033727 [Cinchona calisaya]|uniref:RNase H type-1 domain-containing protein n=1 Tax=Cinchona calisaya TaxID=153742 RepID=A0ABD2Y8U1_9GENT